MRAAERTLMALAMLVALSAPAWAHDFYRFVGVITKVDLKNEVVSLKVKPYGVEYTLRIWLPPALQVTRDEKKVPQTDLRAGLNVVADLFGDGGDDMETTSLRIVPAPAKAQ